MNRQQIKKSRRREGRRRRVRIGSRGAERGYRTGYFLFRGQQRKAKPEEAEIVETNKHL